MKLTKSELIHLFSSIHTLNSKEINLAPEAYLKLAINQNALTALNDGLIRERAAAMADIVKEIAAAKASKDTPLTDFEAQFEFARRQTELDGRFSAETVDADIQLKLLTANDLRLDAAVSNPAAPAPGTPPVARNKINGHVLAGLIPICPWICEKVAETESQG